MHLFFLTTFMTSSLAVQPKPEFVMPKLGTLKPERKVLFYFGNDRIHIRNGEYENRIPLNPLPKDSNNAGDCQPIIFSNISGIYIFDGKKNDYGQAMYLALQFETLDEENNPLAAEIHWICGNEGEVGHHSARFKENRIRVHTASLVAQLYNFMQSNVALQDLSGKMTVTKWTKSNQAVFFDHNDVRVPYEYMVDKDTVPRVFTHRVNAIAEHLGVRKPFLTAVNEANDFTEVPIIPQVNESVARDQENDPKN